MITLRGKVSVQRLSGIVNIVPSAGNPPLQAKVVYPSHDEQIIKPDEDYYGLSVVTAVAVPRIPACVANISGKTGGTGLLEIAVDIAASVSVTGKVFVQTHALYGGVRLPLIPEDILANYPYCWIWLDSNTGKYTAIFSTGIWYKNDSLSAGRLMRRTVSETSPVYEYSAENDEWVFLKDDNSNWRIGNYNKGTITWTNFNVPSESASATSYFKNASEPGVSV